MALGPGNRLGAYEILTLIGSGGMGEVYRARDSKLNREVAIKVLPESLANDPDRLVRFSREAQVLAALNHPNIAHIHGFEDSTGVPALVMELVEGPTLADRIARGPIPVNDALPIAKQIAWALEAAHERGIIHRDLKPANIKVKNDGTVKVLDFGLAKALEPTDASAGAAGLTESPTITTPAMMTGIGMILGTAAYMSPEQAKGRPADKRSDVWAFGCVLYEMLTARRAFEGEDVSDVLAAVLRGEPDWNAYPREVPPHVRAVVKRCLTKDRGTRIPDCAVARFLLDEPTTIEPLTKRWGTWTVAGGAVVLAVAAVALAVVWQVPRRGPIVPARFFVDAPPKSEFATGGRLGLTSAAVSPDGRTIAFTARDTDSKVLLWTREVNAFQSQPMPGTEGAAYPMWSPDSRFIAYATQGKLMRVARTGGPSQIVCSIPSMGTGRGAAWSRNGTIVLNGGPGRLFRVPASGGEPTLLLEITGDHTDYSFPAFLPDGKHVLVYVSAPTPSHAGVYVVSLENGRLTRIVGADSGAAYDAANQVLLFVQQGSLVAQAFDPITLAVQGDAVPITENVVESRGFAGLRAFSISDTGVLVYGTSRAGGDSGHLLTWIDRAGKVIGTVGPPSLYRGIALSPDDQQLAFHRHEGEGGDIWITQLSTGRTTRFTFDPTLDNSSPVWSPDGTRLAFTSFDRGQWILRVKPSNNAGGEETWLALQGASTPSMTSWAPDGNAVVYNRRDEKSGYDIWNLHLAPTPTTDPLVVAPGAQYDGQVSPDGRWLAYTSMETGKLEVYVQPYPSGAGKWQVSTSGGVQPIWRHDGRELFFLATRAGAEVTAAPVTLNGAGLQIGTPVPLFRSDFTSEPHSSQYRWYGVSADGQRFLMPRPPTRVEQPDSMPIAVVLDWAAALKSSGTPK